MEGWILGGLLLVSVARLALELQGARRKDRREVPAEDKTWTVGTPAAGEEKLWAHLTELLSYSTEEKEGEGR